MSESSPGSWLTGTRRWPGRRRQAEAERPWLAGVVGLLCGLLVGAVTLVSVPAAVGVALLLLVLGATRAKLTVLACAALVFVAGVAEIVAGTGAGGVRTKLLVLPIGDTHPSLQVALPLLIVCVAILSATGDGLSRLISVLRRGSSGVLVLWVIAVGVLFVFGLAQHLGRAAGSDLMYYSLYVWVVVPIVLFGRPGIRVTSLILTLILVATILSAALSLAIFASPALRAVLLPGPVTQEASRVGFGTGALYLLLLPTSLLLVGRGRATGRIWVLALVSSVLMTAAVAVSQARTAIVVTALNVLLVFALPGLWRIGVRRWRMVAQLATIAVLLFAGVFVASLLGVRGAQKLPQELATRLAVVPSYSRASSFETRQYSNEVALGRWLATPGSFFVGDGLGSSLLVFDPVYHRPYNEGSFVDNAWVTLAVKGGLVALTFFAALVVAIFIAFVRAARASTDPGERLVWTSLALAFPGFVFATTVMNATLLIAPSAAVTLASFVAAADLCVLRGLRDVRGSVAVVRGG